MSHLEGNWTLEKFRDAVIEEFNNNGSGEIDEVESWEEGELNITRSVGDCWKLSIDYFDELGLDYELEEEDEEEEEEDEAAE